MSEINEKVEPQPIDLGEYKFGFHDDVKPIYSTGKGLNEAVIRELSAAKGEPEWMLDFRLKSLETFNKMPMQTWEQIYQILILMILFIIKKHLINLRVIGMMFQKKSKKLLKELGFQKLKEPILQEHQHNMNQKWFIII